LLLTVLCSRSCLAVFPIITIGPSALSAVRCLILALGIATAAVAAAARELTPGIALFVVTHKAITADGGTSTKTSHFHVILVARAAHHEGLGLIIGYAAATSVARGAIARSPGVPRRSCHPHSAFRVTIAAPFLATGGAIGG